MRTGTTGLAALMRNPWLLLEAQMRKTVTAPANSAENKNDAPRLPAAARTLQLVLQLRAYIGRTSSLIKLLKRVLGSG